MDLPYKIKREGRNVAKERAYDTVEWSGLDSIIDMFKDRINVWYLQPAKTLAEAPHRDFAFAVMALNCIVIDTLGLYIIDDTLPDGTFKNFVRQRLTGFVGECQITHFDSKYPHGKQLNDFADVLYHAFRCGILHEAHVTAYGMVRSGDSMIGLMQDGWTIYKNNDPCPTVCIDPFRLLDEISAVFEQYISELKNREATFDDLRGRFKKKFSESFCVDISNADFQEITEPPH